MPRRGRPSNSDEQSSQNSIPSSGRSSQSSVEKGPSSSRAEESNRKSNQSTSRSKDSNRESKPSTSRAWQANGESRPSTSRAEQSILESRPSTSRAGQPILESRPSTSRAGLSFLESRPSTSRGGQSFLESRPSTSRGEQSFLESRPSTSRGGQSLLESRPSTSRAGQSILDNKPSTSRAGQSNKESRFPARTQQSEEKRKPSASRGSQRSQSSQPSQSQTLSDDELFKLADSLVQLFFTLERTKRAATRQFLMNIVLQGQGRSFKRVLARTKEILDKDFGFLVAECDNRLFLVNKFTPSESTNKLLRVDPADVRERVLLLIILSHIFMEGGCVLEADMWRFLHSSGIEDNDPYYGDVKKLVNKDFVDRMYLKHKRREGSDPTVYEFCEGARGKTEVKKRDLLAFVSEMFGNTVDHWPAHLAQIEREEGSLEASQASENRS